MLGQTVLRKYSPGVVEMEQSLGVKCGEKMMTEAAKQTAHETLMKAPHEQYDEVGSPVNMLPSFEEDDYSFVSFADTPLFMRLTGACWATVVFPLQ